MAKQNTLIPSGFDQKAINGHPKNPRTITEQQLEDLGDYMARLGDIGGITINRRTKNTVAGNQRCKKIDVRTAPMEWFIEYPEPDHVGTVAMGVIWYTPPKKKKPVPFALRLVDWDEETEELALVVSNKAGGDWDWGVLKNFGQEKLLNFGFEFPELELHGLGGKPGSWPGGEDKHPKDVKRLNDSFIVPPFSILDARQGYWRERKKIWLERIGDSGETRQGTLSKSTKPHLMNGVNDGVSIFDPVLAEALLKWFCVPGWKVCDSFAGGIFGYVATATGHTFTGIELREEQATLNNKRIQEANLPGTGRYICDDGMNLLKHVKPKTQDMFFSCPPYLWLEKYSSDPADLSTLKAPEFFEKMNQAFLNAFTVLKPNRFAVLVVGEVRHPKTGVFVNFVGNTIQGMIDAGFNYYNEAILITQGGTLQVRVGRQMDAGRKLGKQHQNVLVFYKGNPKEIRDHFPRLHTEEKKEEVSAEAKGTEKKKRGGRKPKQGEKVEKG